MKKLLVAITLACFVFSSVSYAGDEKKAIIEVIDNEQAAFQAKDFEKWSAYWVHEAYTSQTGIQANSISALNSWDSISIVYKKVFEKKSDYKSSIKIDGYDVHIMDNVAKVFVKAKRTLSYLGQDYINDQTTDYILLKGEDGWKILSMTVVDVSSFEDNATNNEWNINKTGYHFIIANEVDKAIKVFTLNTELYPDAFNTWDSLAEAYMEKGDTDTAIKYYKKSLELNPDNTNAEKMIKKMKSGNKK